MEGSDKQLPLCYNRGCGQRFDPAKNNSKSCTSHPGHPVFHDAYKGWSCCPKKTTDFTEFLNIKGCSVGLHSNVKPQEPEKPKSDENLAENQQNATVITRSPIKPILESDRPSEDSAMVKLNSNVDGTLKARLEALKDKTNVTLDNEANNDSVSIGTFCKNGGCRKNYETESDSVETCMHHPGTPIFHEGMKYWTCCLRKTTDFNNFLEQEGCTVGKHLWFKVKTLEENKLSCRYDWYQTGPFVFVSVYAKLPIPEQSYVEANPVKLRIFVTFDENRNTFELDLKLVGVVDVAQSCVSFTANKVEIKLKKAEPMSWSKLALPPLVKVAADDSKSTDTVELSSLSLNS